MEINGEIFTAMEGKCRKRREELLKFKKGDEGFCEPIGDLLEQFAEELKELAGYRLGSDALKDVNEYLERLREYWRPCGNTWGFASEVPWFGNGRVRASQRYEGKKRDAGAGAEYGQAEGKKGRIRPGGH